LCYPCGGLECVVPDIGRRGTFCQESIAESKNIFKDTQPMRLKTKTVASWALFVGHFAGAPIFAWRFVARIRARRPFQCSKKKTCSKKQGHGP
jgi:hypothetical protein